jgi:hypothetical protein
MIVFCLSSPEAVTEVGCLVVARVPVSPVCQMPIRPLKTSEGERSSAARALFTRGATHVFLRCTLCTEDDSMSKDACVTVGGSRGTALICCGPCCAVHCAAVCVDIDNAWGTNAAFYMRIAPCVACDTAGSFCTDDVACRAD